MQRCPTMKRQERRCKRNILNTTFSVVELLLGEFEPMLASNRCIDPETAPLSRLGAATATLRDKLIQLIQTLSENLSDFRLIQSCQKPH